LLVIKGREKSGKRTVGNVPGQIGFIQKQGAVLQIDYYPQEDASSQNRMQSKGDYFVSFGNAFF
jgi:hypothetical protein